MNPTTGTFKSTTTKLARLALADESLTPQAIKAAGLNRGNRQAKTWKRVSKGNREPKRREGRADSWAIRKAVSLTCLTGAVFLGNGLVLDPANEGNVLVVSRKCSLKLKPKMRVRSVYKESASMLPTSHFNNQPSQLRISHSRKQ